MGSDNFMLFLALRTDRFNKELYKEYPKQYEEFAGIVEQMGYLGADPKPQMLESIQDLILEGDLNDYNLHLNHVEEKFILTIPNPITMRKENGKEAIFKRTKPEDLLITYTGKLETAVENIHDIKVKFHNNQADLYLGIEEIIEGYENNVFVPIVDKNKKILYFENP